MTKKTVLTSALAATMVIGMATPTFAATVTYPEPNQAVTTPSVSFQADDGTGEIVDPLDPQKPIMPIDPENPGSTNKGEFMLTYVSNFDFGAITKTTKTINAKAVDVSTGEGVEEKRAPFVSIKDMRGDRGNGWKLQATATNFKSAGEAVSDALDTELTGALITLSELTAGKEGDANNPAISAEAVALTPGTAVEIASASATSGIGNSAIGFGTVNGELTSGVTLTIPNVAKDTADYSSTITWDLLADPTGI